MTEQGVPSSLPWHDLSFMEKKSLAGDCRQLWYAQSRDIDRDGKPTIVFLHGVLRDWRSFYPLLTALRDDANLVSLDFRGHGQSDSASEYRVMNYVDDAVRLVNALEGPVLLYGHSLGAMVALATAARVPERIKTTVLEDPPFATMGRRLDGSPLMNYFRSVETVVRKELKSAETRLQKSGLQSRIERLFDAFSNIPVGTDANGSVVRLRDQRDETSRRFSAESLASIDPEVLAPITSGQWLEGYSLEELSALVKSKVVILRADAACGGMLMKADADLIVKHAPDRREELFFSGVGHSMHWAQPREIAALVRRHL
ncbi:MAG: alpha/beta hydrolase [Pirellulaceae bacterium]|nr:alpha/beta hydrolase [Pirellulaceae bacterium]